MPMSWAELGQRLEMSLKDAVFSERQVGAPEIGAAVVTVTFAQPEGGSDFFTLVETVMSGG